MSESTNNRGQYVWMLLIGAVIVKVIGSFIPNDITKDFDLENYSQVLGNLWIPAAILLIFSYVFEGHKLSSLAQKTGVVLTAIFVLFGTGPGNVATKKVAEFNTAALCAADSTHPKCRDAKARTAAEEDAIHAKALEEARREREINEILNPPKRPVMHGLGIEAFHENVLGTIGSFSIDPGYRSKPISNFKGTCNEISIVDGDPEDYVLYTRGERLAKKNGKPVKAKTRGLTVLQLGHKGASWDDYVGVRAEGKTMVFSVERRAAGTCS